MVRLAQSSWYLTRKTLKAENQKNIVPPGVLLLLDMDLELLGLQTSGFVHFHRLSSDFFCKCMGQPIRFFSYL
jgi:hypothetical protein